MYQNLNTNQRAHFPTNVQFFIINMENRTLVERICAVMAGASVKKDINPKSQIKYAYQGIDDAVNALNALMAKNEVCFLPISCEVLSQKQVIVKTYNGEKEATEFVVKNTFRIMGGGEFVDVVETACKVGYDDKAITQANSMAFKYALLRSFCVTTKSMSDASEEKGMQDPDSTKYEYTQKPQSQQVAQPTKPTLKDILNACNSLEAVNAQAAKYYNAGKWDAAKDTFKPYFDKFGAMEITSQGVGYTKEQVYAMEHELQLQKEANK